MNPDPNGPRGGPSEGAPGRTEEVDPCVRHVLLTVSVEAVHRSPPCSSAISHESGWSVKREKREMKSLEEARSQMEFTHLVSGN